MAAVLLALPLRGAARRRSADGLAVGLGAFAVGVLGLTLNGAIHDFRLGEPSGWFPLVLVLAIGGGVLAGWAGACLRDRWFPPVHEVRFDAPGLEGRSAKVVSRGVGERPASGRAQLRDEGGVLHLVHCHVGRGEERGFGERVRLEEYDEASGSYRLSGRDGG